MKAVIKQKVLEIVADLKKMRVPQRINALNEIRMALHEVSPFKNEPVDCVLWVPAADVTANDYNPNNVAPPEMELLRRSVDHDGFTQPIVTWLPELGGREVIDGFHRYRVGLEYPEINKRIKGHLPVVAIREVCGGRNDRIAATIRHNRARGKHQVMAMSDIVIELKRRNWSDKKIGRELGMDPDEVLRLTQITGLAEMFKDRDFSEAWEADQCIIDEDDTLNDEVRQ